MQDEHDKDILETDPQAKEVSEGEVPGEPPPVPTAPDDTPLPPADRDLSRTLSAEELALLHGPVQKAAGLDGSAEAEPDPASVAGGSSPSPAAGEEILVPDPDELVQQVEEQQAHKEQALWSQSEDAREGNPMHFLIFASILLLLFALGMWFMYGMLKDVTLPEPEFFDPPEQEISDTVEETPPAEEQTTPPETIQPGAPDSGQEYIDAPSRYPDGSSLEILPNIEKPGGESPPPDQGIAQTPPDGQNSVPWAIPDLIDAPSRYAEGMSEFSSPGDNGQRSSSPEEGKPEGPDEELEPGQDEDQASNQGFDETAFDWESLAAAVRATAANPGDQDLAGDFERILLDGLRLLSDLYRSRSGGPDLHLAMLDQALFDEDHAYPVLDMALLKKTAITPEYVILDSGERAVVLRGEIENRSPMTLRGVLLRGRLTDENGEELGFVYGLAGKDVPTTGLNNMSPADAMSHLLDPDGVRSFEAGESMPFFLYFPSRPEGAANYLVMPVAAYPPVYPEHQ